MATSGRRRAHREINEIHAGAKVSGGVGERNETLSEGSLRVATFKLVAIIASTYSPFTVVQAAVVLSR